MPVAEEGAWAIHHAVPIGNDHGNLWVVDAIDTPLAICKEVAFSVDSGAAAPLYTVDVCSDPKGWKWATAEPAVERWGFLQ